jgi:hypothetical protein
MPDSQDSSTPDFIKILSRDMMNYMLFFFFRGEMHSELRESDRPQIERLACEFQSRLEANRRLFPSGEEPIPSGESLLEEVKKDAAEFLQFLSSLPVAPGTPPAT